MAITIKRVAAELGEKQSACMQLAKIVLMDSAYL